MSALQVYIDFKSAPAYLALQPTLAMLERHGLAAQWRPFITRPAVIPPVQDNETRGETHVRVRAEQRRQTQLRYAAVQGVPMVFPKQPVETRSALAALLHVAEQPLPFIRAAFTAYWRDNLDLDDPAVIAGLLQAAGYPAESFDARDYFDALHANQAEAEEFGVFETPMYLCRNELFLGREQLPWIESLL